MYTIHTAQISEIVKAAAMNGTLAAYPMTIGTMTFKADAMATNWIGISVKGSYSGATSTTRLYYDDSEFAIIRSVESLVQFMLEMETVN